MEPATYCWGGGGEVEILLCMLQAKETGIGSDRLGLCLVCAFSLPPAKKEDGGDHYSKILE